MPVACLLPAHETAVATKPRVALQAVTVMLECEGIGQAGRSSQLRETPWLRDPYCLGDSRLNRAGFNSKWFLQPENSVTDSAFPRGKGSGFLFSRQKPVLVSEGESG